MFNPACDGAQDYDFILRYIRTRFGHIEHIPRVLYHWRMGSEGSTASTAIDHKSFRSGRRRQAGAAVAHAMRAGRERAEIVEPVIAPGRWRHALRRFHPAGEGEYHNRLRAARLNVLRTNLDSLFEQDALQRILRSSLRITPERQPHRKAHRRNMPQPRRQTSSLCRLARQTVQLFGHQ